MHASHIRQIIRVLNTKEETREEAKGLEPVFLVVVKRILILVTHTTPERHKHKSDKLEFT